MYPLIFHIVIMRMLDQRQSYGLLFLPRLACPQASRRPPVFVSHVTINLLGIKMHATIFILSDESEELSTGCWAFALITFTHSSFLLPPPIHSFFGGRENIITDSLEFKIPKERERVEVVGFC